MQKSGDKSSHLADLESLAVSVVGLTDMELISLTRRRGNRREQMQCKGTHGVCSTKGFKKQRQKLDQVLWQNGHGYVDRWFSARKVQGTESEFQAHWEGCDVRVFGINTHKKYIYRYKDK